MPRHSTCWQRWRNSPASGPIPRLSSKSLDALQPRLYSISSSPRVHPARVSLTVDTVRYPVGSRLRLGCASTHLAERINPGDKLRVYVQKAQHFALPADPATSVIMIGPGTGIAPFRAFLHERMATKAPGRNWLFFGHQRRDYDFFYEDELSGMRATGHLNRLTLAWSRDAEEKIYVQHRMADVGRDLWNWITEGAHIYVCGDALRMAKDVEHALIDVIGTHGARTPEQAIAFLADLKKNQPLSDRRLLRPKMTAIRTPIERRSARMEKLARLPVFLALQGRRAVVAGNNAGAAWKVELLAAAGAKVDVFSAEPSEEMLAVAGEMADCVTLHRRQWSEVDFANTAIAIGGCETDEEASRFATAARAAGVPVNVVDKPEFCDFALGSIVNRSPLVIGISTDGAAPVFAQAIRAKLEAMLPKGFAQWAHAALRWRPLLKSTDLSFAARRKFWQSFTAHAVRNPDRVPAEDDFLRFVGEVRDQGAAVDLGTVTLVGAGPGDPELLTLRAVRALQSADVILFDDLVSREVLDFSRREAKKMLVGKTGHRPVLHAS